MELVQRFYMKEVASNKLYIKSTGAPAPFELVGGDTGILATDNPVYTSELDVAAANGVGGVVIIDEATYNDLKKKSSAKPSLSNLVKDRFSLSSLTLPVPQNAAVAVAGSALHGQHPDTPPPSEPIKVPLEFVRPRTGKFLKKQEE